VIYPETVNYLAPSNMPEAQNNCPALNGNFHAEKGP
jgi:hypothetical protein